jgi:cation transport regulator ChaB
MPYATVGDLPPAVKKLSSKKQRQFMHVWNSAYNKCQTDGGGDCEASAFKQAWSVVNKSDENFIAKALKYIAEHLSIDESDIDLENGVSVDLDKSLVYWYPGSGYAYAIDGTNILDLGPQPPELEYGVNTGHSPYMLVVRRSNSYGADKANAEPMKDDDLVKVQAEALKLIEDNKNDVRSVSVCKYTGKTFAGRPVYQAVGRYDYISKSSREENDMSNIDKSSASINDLPDSAFAYIEAGGKKDAGGKTIPRSKRHFPVHDAAHARNALARANQSPFGKKALPKIIAAAKKFGIKIEQGMAASHVSKEYLPYVCEVDKDVFQYVLNSAEYSVEVINKYMEIYDKLHKSVETDVEYEVKLIKGTISEGLVYGVVYAPMQLDSHKDWTSAQEIENAAHNFLPSALKNGDSGWSDINHSKEVNDVEIVESYIAPVDFMINSEPVVKGTWVLVARVNNEELRASIDKGEITGYSLEGKAHKVDVDLDFALGQK